MATIFSVSVAMKTDSLATMLPSLQFFLFLSPIVFIFSFHFVDYFGMFFLFLDYLLEYFFMDF
jgi:hypothetical protein